RSPASSSCISRDMFLYNYTAHTAMYTLSLHDALPISRGEVPFIEPDLAVGVSGAVAMGRLTATTQTPEADAFIIAVPTPFNGDHSADLSFVKAAAEQIATKLRPGNIVVLESTSPPGTTEKVGQWIGALRPDLKLPGSGSNGADIFLAHCPERVLPGRI